MDEPVNIFHISVAIFTSLRIWQPDHSNADRSDVEASLQQTEMTHSFFKLYGLKCWFEPRFEAGKFYPDKVNPEKVGDSFLVLIQIDLRNLSGIQFYRFLFVFGYNE